MKAIKKLKEIEIIELGPKSRNFVQPGMVDGVLGQWGLILHFIFYILLLPNQPSVSPLTIFLCEWNFRGNERI